MIVNNVPQFNEREPLVGIIIINWNGWHDTLECLESLCDSEYANAIILVLDNGSTDDSVGKISEWISHRGHALRMSFEPIILESGSNLGFAEGNNIAIRHLMERYDPRYFLLLNNDTVVASDCLTNLVAFLEDDGTVGMAGPKTYFVDDPERLQLVWIDVDYRRGIGKHVGRYEFDRGQYDLVNKDCHAIQGSCMLIRREVFETAGLFDREFFCYWEEVDICLRTRENGYSVAYCPTAKIWHKGAGSLVGMSSVHDFWMTRNRFYFLRQHLTRRQWWFFLVYFFGFQLWVLVGGSLYRRRFNRLNALFKGVVSGVRLASKGKDFKSSTAKG